MVTRPAHQAAHLCGLIAAAGGIAIPVPALAIEEPTNPAAARILVSQLDDFDIAIFVSTNAAEKGMALIHERGTLPKALQLAAVGRRTAQTLQHCAGRVDIQAPPPYNSEALLTVLDPTSVHGKQIVIFRGEGGRELLGESLRQRGATVRYAEIYRRVKADGGLADTLASAGEIDLVVVTSQEGLRKLLEMAEDIQRRDWLMNRQLVVISHRVAELAMALGFHHPPMVAEQATDEALVETMVTWRDKGLTAQ